MYYYIAYQDSTFKPACSGRSLRAGTVLANLISLATALLRYFRAPLFPVPQQVSTHSDSSHHLQLDTQTLSLSAGLDWGPSCAASVSCQLPVASHSPTSRQLLLGLSMTEDFPSSPPSLIPSLSSHQMTTAAISPDVPLIPQHPSPPRARHRPAPALASQDRSQSPRRSESSTSRPSPAAAAAAAATSPTPTPTPSATATAKATPPLRAQPNPHHRSSSTSSVTRQRGVLPNPLYEHERTNIAYHNHRQSTSRDRDRDTSPSRNSSSSRPRRRRSHRSSLPSQRPNATADMASTVAHNAGPAPVQPSSAADPRASGSATKARSRTTIPTQSGKWILGKTIGAGSMGKVKLAKKEDSSEQASLHNLRHHWLSLSPSIPQPWCVSLSSC